MCVDETCHADPKRVTLHVRNINIINQKNKHLKVETQIYSLKMTRPTNKLKVTVKNVENLCENR